MTRQSSDSLCFEGRDCTASNDPISSDVRDITKIFGGLAYGSRTNLGRAYICHLDVHSNRLYITDASLYTRRGVKLGLFAIRLFYLSKLLQILIKNPPRFFILLFKIFISNWIHFLNFGFFAWWFSFFAWWFDGKIAIESLYASSNRAGGDGSTIILSFKNGILEDKPTYSYLNLKKGTEVYPFIIDMKAIPKDDLVLAKNTKPFINKELFEFAFSTQKDSPIEEWLSGFPQADIDFSDDMRKSIHIACIDCALEMLFDGTNSNVKLVDRPSYWRDENSSDQAQQNLPETYIHLKWLGPEIPKQGRPHYAARAYDPRNPGIPTDWYWPNWRFERDQREMVFNYYTQPLEDIEYPYEAWIYKFKWLGPENSF